jgi:ABC-type nitrate/sulfonate/bicarbonate transport system substrate-binding protein
MRPLRLIWIHFFSLSLCFGGLLIFLWPANRPASAASLEVLRASYSALVPSGAPFWIAHERKLFEKEGLKVDLIYINAAARVLAAMFAGEIQVALSGVNALVSAQARGADPVAIAGAVNKINVSIFALPEIEVPADLKGKKMGITRFGGLYDFAATYALKQWGLQAGKDVALIQIGDAPSIMSALAANAIQAATLQPPSTIRARQLGYRELLDLSKSGLEYQNTVVISRRSIISKSPESFRRFIRAYSRALAVFHTDREVTLRIIGKYLRETDPFMLEKSYEAYLQWVPEVPYVSRRGMEAAIALTSGVEKGKVTVNDVLDETFVAELEQQGFYRTLFKR